MPIVKLTPEYTSDDLESDFRHLLDLVDTIIGALVEVDHGNLDCAEQNKLNWACSVAWIAGNQFELINDRAFPKNDAGAAASS